MRLEKILNQVDGSKIKAGILREGNSDENRH